MFMIVLTRKCAKRKQPCNNDPFTNADQANQNLLQEADVMSVNFLSHYLVTCGRSNKLGLGLALNIPATFF